MHDLNSSGPNFYFEPIIHENERMKAVYQAGAIAIVHAFSWRFRRMLETGAVSEDISELVLAHLVELIAQVQELPTSEVSEMIDNVRKHD